MLENFKLPECHLFMLEVFFGGHKQFTYSSTLDYASLKRQGLKLRNHAVKAGPGAAVRDCGARGLGVGGG